MIGYIYKYTNKNNGKIYVGQTNNIKVRHNAHINCKHNDPFHSAIKHYGMDLFEFEIIEVIEDDDEVSLRIKMNDRERYYILLENCMFPNGYNLTEGGYGTSGKKLSEEHKKKISEANKGKKLSEAHKAKLRSQKRTPEQLEKMSNALKGKIPWNKGLKTPKETIDKQVKARQAFYDNGGPNKGKKLSEEHRKKLSSAHMGKKLSESTKQKLREYNLNHPEIYENRRGRKMCEEQKQKISSSLKGKAQTKGKIWINNGQKTTLINKNELQYYLDNGWIKGRKIK